ncbi:MAG: hypothetical protein L6R38_005714 [Xanthoria sp. 2 TBL-2021]|nr:MAG: hypothetical protein L6R38_005714 [Xanthoria sp. 2 TBL-2021]
MSIRAALTPCLEAFENLIKYTETTEYDKKDEVPKFSWTIQLDRLRNWASNVGALELGNASLDHLLRDPPRRASLRQIRDLIPKILGRIEKLLKEVTDDDVSDVEDDYEELFDDPETPLQGLFDCVQSHIGCLEQHATLIPGSKTADALTRSSVMNNAMLTDARQSALADVESGDKNGGSTTGGS